MATLINSLSTYTLVLLSQVLSNDGLHCSQLLYVSAMECPETTINKSDWSFSSQYPAEINNIIIVIKELL